MTREPSQAAEPPLVDAWGRVVKSLRVSVTDRCNFRCTYCLPNEKASFWKRSEILSFDQIVEIVACASRLGVDRIRITGGEPLLRPKLAELIARLKAETKVPDIALTTNGALLERHAESLAEAGLDRLTVSADSLRPERYRAMTRTGLLSDLWAGVRRAATLGFQPIKINVLVLEGMNDDEIDAWVRLALDHDLVVRFLELMPIGEGARKGLAERYVNLTSIRYRLMED